MRGRGGAPEFAGPAPEAEVEARFDVERGFGIPHPFEAEGDHAGRSEWNKMAGHNHARVAIRTAFVLFFALIDDSDLVAALRRVVRAAHADNAAADDHHSLHRMPQQNGSRSSKMKVASELTKALPVIVGMMIPFSRSCQR